MSNANDDSNEREEKSKTTSCPTNGNGALSNDDKNQAPTASSSSSPRSCPTEKPNHLNGNKKRPLEDGDWSSSPANDSKTSNDKQDMNPQGDRDSNGQGDSNDHESSSSHDHATVAPLAKKARTQDPPSSNQEQDQKQIPVRPVFGSSTTSAFAAFIGKKHDAPSLQPNQPNQDSHSASSFSFSSVPSAAGFGSEQAENKSVGIFGSSTSTSGTASSSFFGKGTLASTGFGLVAGNQNPAVSLSSSTESVFGSTASTLGRFGSTPFGTENDPIGSSPVPIASLSQPIVKLPELKEPIKNGEENEEAILTLRAKLFKLSKVQETSSSTDVDDVVPQETKKVVGIQMATKVGQQDLDTASRDKSKCGDDSGEKNGTPHSTDGNHAIKMDWKEVGIGPLRVLKDDKHARIVQRRENTPGGQGTKLILNVALRKECKVERKGDKFVRFAAFDVVGDKELERQKEEKQTDAGSEKEHCDGTEGGNDKDSVKFELVQYLFKVKTTGEADNLMETLGKYCGTIGQS